MVQFHNGTLRFCELGLGGDMHWLSEPTTCFRIIGEERARGSLASKRPTNLEKMKIMKNVYHRHR